jgi:hypothetical protein
MEGHEEQTHHVKRVVLPSGKTIEVVYFKQPAQQPAPEPAAEELESPPAEEAETHPVAEPDQDLHVCIECESSLVYPVEWQEAGPENWSVLLACPDCGIHREGVFSQETVERFDEELDRGGEELARDYKRLLRANMADEAERFAAALAADAILPEDF